MMPTKNAAIVSIIGLLLALTGPTDAARAKVKAKVNAAVGIYGMVVNHKGKGVAGAHVHVAHHKHRAMAVAKAKVNAVQPKVARAGVHHGTMTAANGSFSMKHRHSGTLMLVAHKKHVGTGHARVSVAKGATANVTIRLHKHHHHHS
jgi:hypothetical protein